MEKTNFKTLHHLLLAVKLDYFILIFFLICTNYTSGNVVTLFDHYNGDGGSLTLNVKSCNVLPRGWRDRVSSLLLIRASCVELHKSPMCNDPSPLLVSNERSYDRIINLNEFNDQTRAVGPCSSLIQNIPTSNFVARVTLYEFVERKGSHIDLNVLSCSNVPPPLYKNTASLNTHGNCIRLYSGPSCTGESVTIQPNDIVGGANLHHLNFLDKTGSVGSCTESQISSLSRHDSISRRSAY